MSQDDLQIDSGASSFSPRPQVIQWQPNMKPRKVGDIGLDRDGRGWVSCGNGVYYPLCQRLCDPTSLSIIGIDQGSERFLSAVDAAAGRAPLRPSSPPRPKISLFERPDGLWQVEKDGLVLKVGPEEICQVIASQQVQRQDPKAPFPLDLGALK